MAEFKCMKCGHTMNDYEINNCWCTNCNKKYASKEEILLLNEEYRQIKEAEIQEEKRKADYAVKRLGLYEYDVVTILNKDHGQVDYKSMSELINKRAREGWRLHTVYSNELGKNAVKILGLGINATACEDVLIFERKLEEKSFE